MRRSRRSNPGSSLELREVPPRTLADAKRDTSAILERARVRVEWAECRLRESDGPKDTACLLPVTPLDLQMRILDRTMAKRARSTRGCLGYALLTGRFDSVAAVFFHRAVDLESGNSSRNRPSSGP